MEKLPISLVVITRNSQERISDVLNKHKDIVSEMIVIDQSSDDETSKIAADLGAYVVNRRCKGTADPDRNLAFSLGLQEWVLYLDDDEYLSQEAIEKLPKLLKMNIDAIWFTRQNLVDGIDIKEVMGDDPQCRLFKRGAVNFPDTIHTYPKYNGEAKGIHVKEYIVHFRTMEGLKKANRVRNPIANPQQIQQQEQFISLVEKYLKDKVNA